MCPFGYTHQPDACTHNRIYPHTSGLWAGCREYHIYDLPRLDPGQGTRSTPHLFFVPVHQAGNFFISIRQFSQSGNCVHAGPG